MTAGRLEKMKIAFISRPSDPIPPPNPWFHFNRQPCEIDDPRNSEIDDQKNTIKFIWGSVRYAIPHVCPACGGVNFGLARDVGDRPICPCSYIGS